MRAAGEDFHTEVAFAGTAGHVLDYDDTFSNGVVHVSATCAPAALLVAARQERSIGDALKAYTEAFRLRQRLPRRAIPRYMDASDRGVRTDWGGRGRGEASGVER